MARGDSIFGRVDINLMYDPRIRKLTAAQKWFYVAAYLTAVEVRSETLPPDYDIVALQDRAGVDRQTARNALEKSIDCNLMERTPDGLIKVLGVRNNHERVQWNEYSSDSPYGARTGPKREEERKNDRISESNHNFELFYSEYPKKEKRQAALEAWIEGKCDNIHDKIMTSLRNQKSSDACTIFADVNFIPYPATWLRDKRWEDEVLAREKSKSVPRNVLVDQLVNKIGLEALRLDDKEREEYLEKSKQTYAKEIKELGVDVVARAAEYAKQESSH